MEWLQQLIDWAQAHPGWSLAAAFFLSVIECTVLIGLFIPGAAVLFGIGALVAVGALPFGPTLALIAAGALAGDVLSYELGRRYGEALFRRPFFTRRPGLILKGGAFFRRHGGKGLVLAHLIGPLRPVIPAIGGAYGLSRLRFIAAIVPAAAAWTFVYVLPGVVFGASLGLAAEVTKRLVIVMLVLALTLWAALWISRRAVIGLGRNAERWLNRLTDWSHLHGPLGRIGALADPRQPELPALFSLGLVLLLAGAAAIGITWWIGGAPPASDLYTHDALQNLHDPWGIRFAAIALLPGDPAAYASFATVLMLVMLWQRRWDVARHLLAVLLFGIATTLALGFAPGLRVTPESSALHLRPDLVLPISLYALVPVLFGGGASLNARIASYGLTTAVLMFLVLARFYLGAFWLSTGLTTLVIGLVWTASVGVSFRRHGARDLSLGSLWPAIAALVLGMALGSPSVRMRLHAALPDIAPREIVAGEWWSTGWRKLPTRRVDLAGRDKQFLNLQWAGSLAAIRQGLQGDGWQAPPPLTFANGLHWLASSGPIAELPLMPRMHEGHYAVLTMRHTLDDDRQWMIRLWPSGYVLDRGVPLWIGSITGQRAGEFFRVLRYPVSDDGYTAAVSGMAPPGFEIKDVRRSAGSFTIRLMRPAEAAAR